MAVAVTVLASGSRGNCTVIASNGTRILVDAGLSCRETFKRMQAAGQDARTLSAIVISHEHSDHVYGLPGLIKKLNLPVYMTGATRQAWKRSLRNSGVKCEAPKCEEFSSGRSFWVGDVNITPFTVPHDAADPVGFTFQAQGIKIALVTDLGYMPANVKQHIRGCDALILESNHDLEMLRGGPYPWVVKQRVMSRVGHLSNDSLAEFFSTDYDGGAAFLVLAHLSEANNHPELARQAAERALGGRLSLIQNRLVLASQNEPMEAIRF